MTFQLDMSGEIDCRAEPGLPGISFASWSNLTPFTQGYVGALLATVPSMVMLERGNHLPPAAFRDLAPATLVRIMADCERFEAEARVIGLWDDTASQGAHFWKWRQANKDEGFPPLTVALDDAGKVVFR